MANNKLAFNPLTGGFDLVTDVSTIEGDISGIENRDKILAIHAFEDNQLIWGSGQPPLIDPAVNSLGEELLRDGWYFENKVAGQKISWYFFDGATQATIQKSGFSCYTVVTLDVLLAKPIFGIYSFPTGSGDIIPGFAHSRWIYEISTAAISTMTAGKKYLLYVGENPSAHPEVPHIALDLVTIIPGGDQNPSETIFTAALNSDSGEPVGEVKWMVESLGVWSENYKHELALRFKSLYVQDFHDSQELVKEPTGFVSRTTSTISFNEVGRQFTIAPTGSTFDVYIKGNKYSKASTSITIPNTSGNHYIYFNSAGTLSSTMVITESLFADNALVAIVYWNADTQNQFYFGEERHGLVMDGATHGYLHTVFGARYISGCALQGFTIGSGSADADAQFSADSGSIRDEDILHQFTSQAQLPVLYRSGQHWRKKPADAYPFIQSGVEGYTGVDGRIAFNEYTGGAWQLSEVPNNQFTMVHVFATNDINTPYVAIIGTNTYATKPDAQDSANSEIASLTGIPFAEFVAIGTVIMKTADAFTNSVKAAVEVAGDGADYVDFRGAQIFAPSGQASNHSLLSNLDKDDHIQYFNESRGDARYVLKAGDTMSGSLTIDNGAGGTNILDTEGTHIVAGDISTEYARMGYFMNLVPTPTYQKYSDGGIGYLSLGENDSSTGVGRMIDLQLTGIKMTETTDNGVTNLPIMPTLPEHVVVKKYVDDAIASSGGAFVNNVVDNFSGDSSTTDFILSTTPISKQYTNVYIGGVYQFKSTYSIAGTTLSFTSPPPTGTNNIEVEIFQIVSSPVSANLVEIFNSDILNGSGASSATGIAYYTAPVDLALGSIRLEIFDKGSATTGNLTIDVKKNTSADPTGMVSILSLSPSISMSEADYFSAIGSFSSTTVNKYDVLRLDITSIPAGLGKFRVLLVGTQIGLV
jgi:hypothetical protein